MSYRRVLYVVLSFVGLCCVSALSAVAEEADTLKILWLDPIEVTAERADWGRSEFPAERDNFSAVLNNNGFALVRKGDFFAQDVYADGLKRGDISLVIDGERYHNACPNRMDSPLTRVNPMEMQSIDLVKSCGSASCGLGGSVEFHRETPARPLKIKAGLTRTAASMNGTDAAFLVNWRKHRLNGRYATGETYENGDGRSFVDLYNYENEPEYILGELSFRGIEGDMTYGASFTYTEDVAFPYLMMDERENSIYSGYMGWKKNKVYFNYTDHLMDNDLRGGMMAAATAETDAKNFTLGATGEYYDIFYRNWDADHTFENMMTRLECDLMPDVNQFSAAVHKKFEMETFLFSAKVGATHYTSDQGEYRDYYPDIYPDADDNRWYVNFGLAAGVTRSLDENLMVRGMLELASEPPEAEQLYTFVLRPSPGVNRIANPELKAPLRATARTAVSFYTFRLELFGTHIWDYSQLYRMGYDGANIMSYKNIDALMGGLIVNAAWDFLDINASYTVAENTTDDTPLSEIQPLMIISTLKTPFDSQWHAFARHTLAARQNRIDASIGETATGSWNTLDIGVAYTYQSLRFSIEIDNVADHNYHRHLSYLRNPFMSGNRVDEPGMTLRFNVNFTRLFETD